MSDSRALVPAKARENLRDLVNESHRLVPLMVRVEGTLVRVGERNVLSPFRVTQALDALADSLEEVAFRTVLAEEVPAPDRVRLLSGMGDLASSSMLAASPEDAVQAMLAMAEDDAAPGVREDRYSVSAFTLYSVLGCAHYMRERGDWDEVLDVVIDETDGYERTLRHWIVAAVWYEAGCPRRVGTEIMDGVFEPIDELAPGVFDEAGLGHDEGLELMAQMLSDSVMPQFDRDEFEAARKRFVAAQTRVREEAAAALREREAAAKAADDLDV